jgi:hypothetical protein
LPLHLENQQFPVSFQDACLAVIHPSHFFIHSPPICPSNTLASSPFRAPRVLIPSCTLGNPFFSSFPCSTSSHISVLNSISCAKKPCLTSALDKLSRVGQPLSTPSAIRVAIMTNCTTVSHLMLDSELYEDRRCVCLGCESFLTKPTPCSQQN